MKLSIFKYSFTITKSTLLVILILLIAAFFRLYRIADYMTFLGDEGRDALVVKHIVEGFQALLQGNIEVASKNLTLLGPRSSAADFYYGPIYYYMMAPFFALFHMDPVGPAIMIAILGIITVGLVYIVGKNFFGEKAGIIASFLYAISPLVIAYSRSSWNPNPLPFVALLSLFLVYKAVEKSKKKLFFIVGILLGIAMQLQYLAVFLITIIILFVAAGSYIQKKKFTSYDLLKKYIVIAVGFLVGFSPFLAFEFKHGFPNTKIIVTFMLGGIPPTVVEKTVFNDPLSVIFKLFARLLFNFPPPEQIPHLQLMLIVIWSIFVIIGIGFSIYYLFKHKNKLQKILLMLWLFLGVGFFIVYKKQIYDYYFGFMFPLPFLLIGNVFSQLWSKKKTVLMFSIVAFLYLTALNLSGAPFRGQPNRQFEQVKNISRFVFDKAGGKPFNFALITSGNSDHAYRYFFELWGNSPVVIEFPGKDPARKTVTDQLLVICESLPCEPVGHSLWEVAGFGRAEIAGEWDVSVVKVYKLVHYKGK